METKEYPMKPGYRPAHIRVVITKTCSKCLTEKSFQHFNRNAASSVGLSSWCRACLRRYRNDHNRLVTRSLAENRGGA